MDQSEGFVRVEGDWVPRQDGLVPDPDLAWVRLVVEVGDGSEAALVPGPGEETDLRREQDPTSVRGTAEAVPIVIVGQDGELAGGLGALEIVAEAVEDQTRPPGCPPSGRRIAPRAGSRRR
jgi:hypothetical protein